MATAKSRRTPAREPMSRVDTAWLCMERPTNPMMITGVPPQLGQIKAGRLRPLAVATSKRLALFPELPTIAEAGVAGYEATQWYGVLAPAGTPRDIVAKLNAAISAAIKGQEVRDRLATEAAEPVGNSPEEFHAYIKQEIARWAPVIKASGARPD